MPKQTDDSSKNRLHPDVAYWLDEIEASRKREKEFAKEGARICQIYEGSKREETPFNILFSNTETLSPALYSATPRPVVQRRFKDDDPLGRAAAQAAQRILEFQLDTNIEGYETFDEAMKYATLDALLPGRGMTFVKYDAEVLEEPNEETEEAEPAYKEAELVCCETKPWNRLYLGFARKWSRVPWLAEELYLDRDEAARLFGKKLAAKLTYTEGEPVSEDDGHRRDPDPQDARHQGRRKTAHVYQIWDKDGGRKIRYISPSYKDGELLVQDDPLQLTGFFPCPRPLTFIEKTTSLTPTAPYTIYATQARELNRLTIRISHIVEAIKARGAYDSSLGDELSKVMQADDNMLVPADRASSLATEKGFQNAIWFLPIEQLIATLMQLYQAREQCKQTIYEITGISDIVRGASKASETLGAQQIKTQWGTLRLKNKQKEVARYARDLLRMMLELAAQNFSEETWAKMTGLPFLLSAQFNELTAIERKLAQELAMHQAAAAPPGAPPAASPLIAQLQQIRQQLQTPQWEQILAILKDDLQRAYRVDIETNSTIEPEAAEDKQNIVDLMTTLGQFLQGVTPLVVKGALPFEAAQTMMLTIARRFRFGTEIEDSLKAMQPPAPEPQGDQGAGQIAKMQQQMGEQALQMKQSQAESGLQVEKLKMEHQLQKRSTEQDVRELSLKHEQE